MSSSSYYYFPMEQSQYSIPVILLSSFSIIFISLKIVNNLVIRSRNSKLRLPPGPRGLPLIGNIHQLVGVAPHHLLHKLAGKYGSLVYLKLGETSLVVINSAESAKEAMKNHDTVFASRPLTLPTDLLLYNALDLVFAPYGDYWRKIRKICVTELLSPEKVRSFRSVRENEASVLAKAIASSAGSPVNLSKLLFSATYQIISGAAVGSRGRYAEKSMEVMAKISYETSNVTLVDIFPSYKKLLHVFTQVQVRKLEKIHNEIDQLFEEVIKQHKSERTAKDYESKDILDVLLDIQEESRLSDRSVKAIVMDVILPGMETSATTLEWAMSEMLRNPHILNKAQAEVRKVFAENSSGVLKEAELHQVEYLKLIIKETLRLHPPVPLLPRENAETCEISGYDVPAKSRILINAYAIGRDPKNWEDPETFSPERFIDSSIDLKGSNFELIPFGAGRRICPGMTFSMSSMELLLATLLYHFDWELPDGRRAQDLDMAEAVGATVRRKHDLLVVPLLPSHH